jgi:uncharacterized protein (DUF302 family)
MAPASVSSRTISVEHVTIGCSLAFDAVRTKLEAQLPWLDHTILQRVQDGDVAGALRLIEDAPPLSIFSARDHGGLLAIAGLHRRAVQYEIGNPLTATKMTRQRISAALYAPVRVLLREDSGGEVAFEYDRPASTFGQFSDGQIDAVAQKLDRALQTALTDAASSLPLSL